MHFVIIVKNSPLLPGTSTAYRVCCALIAANHQIDAVFFHQDGVYSASSQQDFPADEANLFKLWEKMHTEHHIQLLVCSTSAIKRGVICASKFTISRLAELIELSVAADRVLTF